MRRILVAIVIAAAGCASPGTLVERHESSAAPAVQPVDQAGVYGLYIAGEREPLLTYPLRAGDTLGFEAAAKPLNDQLQIGWLYSVAGGDRRRLDAQQTYEWRRMSDDR